MSDTQLLFVRHWIRKGRDDAMKRLGGLLGVFWTSENYNPKTSGEGSNERLSEIWVPLLSALAPEVLQKTLKNNLKTRDEVITPAQRVSSDGEYDMSQVPATDYLKMFNGGIPAPQNTMPPPPDDPTPRAIQPLAKTIPPPTKSPGGLNVEFDLEKIALQDPELAQHLRQDASW